MKSKVSVIVPCYKQAQYLSEALDSVLAQSYSDWECFIVNDGSPDHTEEVALEYCKKDSRFKYIKKENGGLSSARNIGIIASKGIYILPLDADDKIGNEYLERAVEVLDADENIKLVYGEVEFFGNQEGAWKLPDFTLNRLAESNIIYASAFFRRREYERVGGYDQDFLFGLEDWEFWLRILKNGGNVKRLESVHFYYRKKDNSMIHELVQHRANNIHMRNMIYVKHLDFYTELYGDLIQIISDKKTLEIRLKETEEQLEQKVIELQVAYQSKSNRIGNLILKPFRLFKWKK